MSLLLPCKKNPITIMKLLLKNQTKFSTDRQNSPIILTIRYIILSKEDHTNQFPAYPPPPPFQRKQAGGPTMSSSSRVIIYIMSAAGPLIWGNTDRKPGRLFEAYRAGSSGVDPRRQRTTTKHSSAAILTHTHTYTHTGPFDARRAARCRVTLRPLSWAHPEKTHCWRRPKVGRRGGGGAGRGGEGALREEEEAGWRWRKEEEEFPCKRRMTGRSSFDDPYEGCRPAQSGFPPRGGGGEVGTEVGPLNNLY